MILTAIALAAALSGQDPNERVVCKPDAMTTLDLNDCALVDYIREEGRLRVYLAKAQERAEASDAESQEWGPATDQVGYLARAQEAWVKYAEETCAGVYDAYSGGAIRTVMHLGCMIEMTQERTHRIWQDHLTYMDSTPPVLPEPTEPAGAEYDPVQ